MTKVLYINASPRSDSVSNQAAELFLEALSDSCEATRIDLFKADLPEVTEEVTSAKVKFIMGMDLTDEEQAQWSVILEMVEQLRAADHYLLAVPMWNFSIPYKLKHYIDLVNHPNLTFGRDENGPHGLVAGTGTVLYARGGDYAPKDGKPDPLDFQSTYLKAWLTSIGVAPVEEILLQNTMFGPDAVSGALDAVKDQLQSIASGL